MCIFGSFSPLGSACIYFGVQIKACKKHPYSGFVGTIIACVSRLLSLSLRKLWLNFEQFFLYPVVYLGAFFEYRLRERFGKRHIPESIHEEIIL